jgi:hypothetical protein
MVRRNNTKNDYIYCTFFPVFIYFSVILVQGAHKRTSDFQKSTEKKRGAQAPSHLLQTMRSRCSLQTTRVIVIARIFR